MSLGYIWDIQGIYWDMQAPTKQAFPKLNILTRFSGTGGRQNRCSLDSGIAYQSHFGPQLGKERKVQTRTELWNNTPKKTLRYKVEKRVHGSEEKAGIQTKTHRAKFQKVSAPAARGYRRVTSTRPNSQDASKIYPPSSKLKYSLFRGVDPTRRSEECAPTPKFQSWAKKDFFLGGLRALAHPSQTSIQH